MERLTIEQASEKYNEFSNKMEKHLIWIRENQNDERLNEGVDTFINMVENLPETEKVNKKYYQALNAYKRLGHVENQILQNILRFSYDMYRGCEDRGKFEEITKIIDACKISDSTKEMAQGMLMDILYV